MTALHWAARNGHLDAVGLLLDMGAPSDTRCQMFGWTPLCHAISQGKPAVAKLLIERGTDIHSRDQQGLTPLHLAARAGISDIASLLLEHGAAVNARESVDGNTPLHFAAAPDVAEVLLRYGADMNATERYRGMTPLECARLLGHDQVAALLEQRRSVASQEASGTGKTPVVARAAAGEDAATARKTGQVPEPPETVEGRRHTINGTPGIQCAACGTVYDRAGVIAEIRKQSPLLFSFAGWTTKFVCQTCGAHVVISSEDE